MTQISKDYSLFLRDLTYIEKYSFLLCNKLLTIIDDSGKMSMICWFAFWTCHSILKQNYLKTKNIDSPSLALACQNLDRSFPSSQKIASTDTLVSDIPMKRRLHMDENYNLVEFWPTNRQDFFYLNVNSRR
jgi:hypothetical protein